jgi:hypothetical protein
MCYEAGWRRLTLLECIFQLIRPNRLAILACITPRTCSIFHVLLRLEVAASASRSYIRPD